jgi:hypothetical protein
MLEQAKLAIRAHIVAKRGAAGVDRIGDHRPDRLDQAFQAFGRPSVTPY